MKNQDGFFSFHTGAVWSERKYEETGHEVLVRGESVSCVRVYKT